MRRRVFYSAIGAVVGLGLASSASAQQDEQQQQQAQQHQQEVSQCREDLQTLALRMQEDGYWLAGYPRAGLMGPTQFPGDQPTVPTEPGAVEAPAVPADPAVPAEDQMAMQHPEGPWGVTGWQHQPEAEFRVLYQAALVLDRHGDDEVCAQLVQAMAERYQDQVAQLEELGVDPAEVTAWRQSQIAEALPVTEAFTHVQVDHLIGLNVRTPDDRSLGSVGDVLLDPQAGRVQYVTISRGGFFGIGDEEVAVPWDMLYITADFTSLVLPTDEATPTPPHPDRPRKSLPLAREP
jgi:sporulation protein YlmC with PRC-barrel domain